jgi:hypothetical protein
VARVVEAVLEEEAEVEEALLLEELRLLLF